MSASSTRVAYNDSKKGGVLTSSPISQHYSRNSELELRGRAMAKDCKRTESSDYQDPGTSQRKSMPCMSADSRTNDTRFDLESNKGYSAKTNQSLRNSTGNHNHPGGDSCVHYQSIYQPHILNRCWTISDFKQAIQVPSVMKNSFSLEFTDASPPLTFRLKVNKSGILVLKTFVTTTFVDKIKDFKHFVKVGVSVGPHKVFGTDFAVESPVFQAKKLPKLNLEILEANRLLESYLVDGGLNLIVRCTTLIPVTSPVKNSFMFHHIPSEHTINCCNDFVIRSSSNDYKSESPTSEQQNGCNPLITITKSSSSTGKKQNQSGLDSENEDSFTRNSSFFRKSFPLESSKSQRGKPSKSQKFRKSEASVRSSNLSIRSVSNISSSSLAVSDFCNSNHSDVDTQREKSCSGIYSFDEDESPLHCDKTTRSIPRALSTSKVMAESKDMMALDWDVSTVQFSPQNDYHN